MVFTSRLPTAETCVSGASRRAIQVYGAAAAGADAASELRSLEVENVSEHPQKGHIRGHIYCFRLPVNSECRA